MQTLSADVVRTEAKSTGQLEAKKSPHGRQQAVLVHALQLARTRMPVYCRHLQGASTPSLGFRLVIDFWQFADTWWHRCACNQP